jgi:replicative DNA helicase
MTDRVQPHDHGAEQAVLGGMLLSRHVIPDVADLLTAADFHTPAHELAYDAILTLYARGEGADAVTTAAELAKRGELARVGGAPYLHQLTGCIPTAANTTWYAQIVRDHAVRRRLIEAGTRIAQMGYETDGDDLPAIVDRAQAEVHALTPGARTEAEPSNLEVYDQVLEEIDQGVSLGLMTGFMDLDQLTMGLQPGQMIIIAARPSLGKTTLGLDIARHVSIHHHLRTAFFSLEMNRKELIRRAIAAEARVPLHHLGPGLMTPADWKAVADARDRVTSAPLHIDDDPGLTAMRIRTKARRLQQTGGLHLIVIDYMQLVSSGAGRHENRQTEVSAISRSLKLLAKELQVPVVVLAQLNRGPEQRADKRPMLSDLRESGSLEQDADVVILLHREDAYERESPRAGEADLIVAKHRNGPTAVITVAFQGYLSRFVDMARSEWSPSDVLNGGRR